jgi:CheY-like chemotaxis protein/cytidylate kinase
MAVIAILSGSYCHGELVETAVAEQLQYPMINDDLLALASERHSIGKDRLLRSLTGPDPFFNKFSRERQKNLAYLEEALAELIQRDNVLLTGCAVFLIPGNIGHVLKVCLIANQRFRINLAMEQDHLAEAAATERIEEYDKQVASCANYLLDKPAYDETLFDLVVPMQDTPVDKAIEMIRGQALSDAIRTTERSRELAADFLLAAKVKVALAEAGHDVDVFAESGRVTVRINEQAVRMGKLESKLKRLAGDVPGVTEVTTGLGPKFNPPSLNPWNRIEMPPKIMLVDDEKEFVHTLSERLKTRNLESAIAYDGEQALEMLDRDVPDVIVLDLKMPGIDGIETLRRVKGSHPDVEVIILTGHGSDQEQVMAEELGAFAYLHKPVNINELAQVMREAYARKTRKR